MTNKRIFFKSGLFLFTIATAIAVAVQIFYIGKSIDQKQFSSQKVLGGESTFFAMQKGRSAPIDIFFVQNKMAPNVSIQMNIGVGELALKQDPQFAQAPDQLLSLINTILFNRMRMRLSQIARQGKIEVSLRMLDSSHGLTFISECAEEDALNVIGVMGDVLTDIKILPEEIDYSLQYYPQFMATKPKKAINELQDLRETFRNVIFPLSLKKSEAKISKEWIDAVVKKFYHNNNYYLIVAGKILSESQNFQIQLAKRFPKSQENKSISSVNYQSEIKREVSTKGGYRREWTEGAIAPRVVAAGFAVPIKNDQEEFIYLDFTNFLLWVHKESKVRHDLILKKKMAYEVNELAFYEELGMVKGLIFLGEGVKVSDIAEYFIDLPIELANLSERVLSLYWESYVTHYQEVLRYNGIAAQYLSYAFDRTKNPLLFFDIAKQEINFNPSAMKKFWKKNLTKENFVIVSGLNVLD